MCLIYILIIYIIFVYIYIYNYTFNLVFLISPFPQIWAVDSPLVFWFSSRRQARLLDQELQRNITKAALRLGRAKDATQAAQARHGWGSSLGYLLGCLLEYLLGCLVRLLYG